MLESFSPPDALTAVLEEPIDGGAVSLGVDVRPEGVTFLARVRLYSRRGAGALPTSEPGDPDGAPLAASRQLEGHRGWARDFLERAREQMAPVIQAEACRALASLADENGRLREALAECVSACGELLDRADEAGCEGCEGDRARAWLALDRAREVLDEPPLLTPAAPPGPAGSRSLPGPR